MSQDLASFNNILAELQLAGVQKGNSAVPQSASECGITVDEMVSSSLLIQKIHQFYPKRITRDPVIFGGPLLADKDPTLEAEGDQDSKELENPLRVRLETALVDVYFYEAFYEALKMLNLDKRAYVFWRIEGDNPQQPLDQISDLSKAKLVAIPRDNVTVDDEILPTEGSSANPLGKDTVYYTVNGVRFHKSRVFELEDDVEGPLSLIEMLYPAVTRLENVYPVLSEVIRSYSTPILGMSNLTNLLATSNNKRMNREDGNAAQRVLDRLNIFRLCLNVFGALAFDKTDEEVTFAERNISGMEKAYDPLIDYVIAISCIPESELLGVRRASGGFSGDSGEREAGITAQEVLNRQRGLARHYKRIFDVVLPALEGYVDEQYKFEFQSTIILSRMDRARIDKLDAETLRLKADAANVGNESEFNASNNRNASELDPRPQGRNSQTTQQRADQ